MVLFILTQFRKTSSWEIYQNKYEIAGEGDRRGEVNEKNVFSLHFEASKAGVMT